MISVNGLDHFFWWFRHYQGFLKVLTFNFFLVCEQALLHNNKRPTGLVCHLSIIALRLTCQRGLSFILEPNPHFTLKKRGRIESEESQIIYTLAPGAKNYKFLVKKNTWRPLMAIQLLYSVLFIMPTTCIQLISTRIQCTEN